MTFITETKKISVFKGGFLLLCRFFLLLKRTKLVKTPAFKKVQRFHQKLTGGFGVFPELSFAFLRETFSVHLDRKRQDIAGRCADPSDTGSHPLKLTGLQKFRRGKIQLEQSGNLFRRTYQRPGKCFWTPQKRPCLFFIPGKEDPDSFMKKRDGFSSDRRNHRTLPVDRLSG